ncbi:MAG: hypothetical protein L3J74_15280 [Bacteroidales bacterium]|nr:hypothetical protein [Bacteroidales bacterium]
MNKDTLIMLAWPETPAIQVGSWYEPLMRLSGFNKNGYYKAGHSAIVLINHINGELKYFDFGRYHTPAKFGRVRDEITDPNLKISLKAKFDADNRLLNQHQILLYLSKREDFHGYGKMYASFYYGIYFNKAYTFAKNQQKEGAILYGPFAYKGTNCSRFTSRVLRVGTSNIYKKFQTMLPLSLTQTPMGNVLISAKNNIFYEVENNRVKQHTANIFTFFAHWTLPPAKAVPIILKNKAIQQEHKTLNSSQIPSN